jgi:hypothetical protein
VDDVDVGKPRLPWTAAGDGVGRATAFDGDRRAPGRGRRPWARGGAAWDRRPWAGAAAVGLVRRAGERRDGGGATGERGGGRAGAAGRRWGGDVGRRRADGGEQNGGAGAGVERARGERNRKEEERARQWLFRITPVGLAARPTGVS